MSNPAEFSVTARSRHPRLNLEYDREEHRYRDHHLNPQWGVLEMDAFPGVEVIDINPLSKDTSPSQKLPAGKNNGPLDIEIRRLKVPNDAVAYDWTIQQVNGAFQDSSSHPIQKKQGMPVSDGNPYQWSVRVPEPGEYRIEAKVRRETGHNPRHMATFRLRNFFVVSLGDSYASGEGNPDSAGELSWTGEIAKQFTTIATALKANLDMDREPVWLEEKAHRSLICGPAMATRSVEDPEAGDLVTFVSYARSGAEIQDGLFGPRTAGGNPIDGWINNLGQLEELKRDLQRMRSQVGDRPVDALLISIGGNDTGFSGRLAELVALDLTDWGDDNIHEVRAKVQRALAQLRDDFAQLAAAIADLNVRQVYLTEYPTAHFERILDDGRVEVRKGCGIFSGWDLDIEKDDARLMKSAAEQLNDLLRETARTHGWVYIGGVADGFRGRGYCMGGDSFFRSAEGSFEIQGDMKGTMHPNEAGHRVYAQQIAAALQKHMVDGQPVEPAPGRTLSLLRALDRRNIDRPVSVQALQEQFNPLIAESLRSLIKTL